MTMRRVFPACAAVLLLALAGCGGDIAKEQFYRLGQPVPVASQGVVINGVLEVPRLWAGGILNEQPIVYTYDYAPDIIRQYRSQFWVDPPGVMTQERLARYLRDAGVASQVVVTNYGTQADYAVKGELRRMELVAGTDPRVIVEIDLGIVRNSDDKLLFSHTYYQEKPIPRSDPESTVQGMNSAINDIFAAYLADLYRMKPVSAPPGGTRNPLPVEGNRAGVPPYVGG